MPLQKPIVLYNVDCPTIVFELQYDCIALVHVNDMQFVLSEILCSVMSTGRVGSRFHMLSEPTGARRR